VTPEVKPTRRGIVSLLFGRRDALLEPWVGCTGSYTPRREMLLLLRQLLLLLLLLLHVLLLLQVMF